MNKKIEYLKKLYLEKKRQKEIRKVDCKDKNGMYYAFLGICVFVNRVEFTLLDILGQDITNDFFDTNMMMYEGKITQEGKNTILKLLEKITLTIKKRKDLQILQTTISVYSGIHLKEERAFFIEKEQSYFITENMYTELPEAEFMYDTYTVAAEDAAGIYISTYPQEVYYIKESLTRDFVLYDPLTGCISCFNKGKLIETQGKHGNLTSKEPIDISMLNNMQLIDKQLYVDYAIVTKKQFCNILETYLISIVRTLEPRNIIIGGEAIREHDMNGLWEDSYNNVLKQISNNTTSIHSFNTSQFNSKGAAIYSNFKFFDWKLEWDNII